MDPAPNDPAPAENTSPGGNISPQHRLSVGSILSRSWQVMLNHFGRLLGLSALANLPAVAFALLLEHQYLLISPTTMWALGAAIVLLDLVLQALLQGAVAAYVFLALRGGRPSFAATLNHLRPAAGPVLLASLLMAVGIAIGLCLLYVPAVVVICLLAVTIPACVAERSGTMDSLSRSIALTRGYRTEVFFLFLVTGLATWLPYWIVMAVLRQTVADYDMLMIIETVLRMLVYLFSCLVSTSLYVSLREVKDGLDANSLSEVFE